MAKRLTPTEKAIRAAAELESIKLGLIKSVVKHTDEVELRTKLRDKAVANLDVALTNLTEVWEALASFGVTEANIDDYITPAVVTAVEDEAAAKAPKGAKK